MNTRQEQYRAIAAQLRQQPATDQPLKHEWVELLTRLSHDDDPQLRELGISELSRSAEQATRKRHV